MDSKHDLAVFALGPDPRAVPIEEQLTILALPAAGLLSLMYAPCYPQEEVHASSLLFHGAKISIFIAKIWQ